jgi:hypothetical protein
MRRTQHIIYWWSWRRRGDVNPLFYLLLICRTCGDGLAFQYWIGLVITGGIDLVGSVIALLGVLLSMMLTGSAHRHCIGRAGNDRTRF